MYQNTHGPELMNEKVLLPVLEQLFRGRHLGKWRRNYITGAVVETGTFRGTGTTLTICKTIAGLIHGSRARLMGGRVPKVYTIEASETNCQIARENLQRFSFCQVIHGASLDRREMIEFIENDEAILQHEKWPQYAIDDAKNPVEFYTKEVKGQLFEEEGKGKLGENNVFRRLIPKVANYNPLFVLDSAGGIGYLEFQKVVEMMDRRRYAVLLDDINHLKHFRSYLYAKRCNWEILCEEKDRWALFLKKGESGNPAFVSKK